MIKIKRLYESIQVIGEEGMKLAERMYEGMVDTVYDTVGSIDSMSG